MPVAVLTRTLIVVLLAVAVFGAAPLALAEPAAQAATATPTTTSGTTPTPIPCVTAPFGIQLVLENPQPGDTLLSGSQVVMNGIAYDTGATSGSGISSVTIYLGDRDQGGLALGTATLGQPNPQAPAGSQFANSGFTLRTPPLPTGNGGRTIFVYARSIVGNAERVLQVPIFLNSQPTPVRGQVPTAALPTPPACTPTPTPRPTATPTVALPPAAPAAGTATATQRATATSTTITTPKPAVPAAAPAVSPAASPPAAAAPPAAAPAAAPTAAQTAPRGGGIPAELGLLLLAAGATIVGGGLALWRRERRRTPHR